LESEENHESQSQYGLKIFVFWVVVPCNLVDSARRYRGTYSHHHQGDEQEKGIAIWETGS
jgi:hypothetical protein